MRKTDYLKEISARGDAYGGNGGILDLLEWCGKLNTTQVTEEEARRFWHNPAANYHEKETTDPDKSKP